MQLPTQSNQFLFSLPQDFISEKIEKKWMPLLKKNKLVYTSVIDFLNSTIRGLTFPSLQLETTEQPKRTKKVSWKTVANVYDLFTKEMDITFQSVDSNINHLILIDAISDSYLNTSKFYVAPLTLTILDKHRDMISQVHFRSVNIRSLSEVNYSYSDISLEDKTFTLMVTYNYVDVISLIDSTDIIKDEGVPPARKKLN